MRGTILKKGITLIGVLVAMLAVTSGAFAAHHYLITSSSQIKDGAVSLSDLSPAARQALLGQKAATSAAGRRVLPARPVLEARQVRPAPAVRLAGQVRLARRVSQVRRATRATRAPRPRPTRTASLTSR